VIARTWRGATAARDAEEYLQYLQKTGLSDYASTPGNRGVIALRRIVDERAEFLLISLWDSMDAIRAFAGDEPAKAVFYPEDDQYLVDRDLHVDHFDLLHTALADMIERHMSGSSAR
jgi:heme-degrading monooxygenase HmoA